MINLSGSPAAIGWLAVALACGLDRVVGDPAGCLHPVQVMGWSIALLRGQVETWAGDRPWKLRLGGGAITLLLVGVSGAVGWGVEMLAWRWPPLGYPLLWLCLASCLAAGSLERAVRGVLDALSGGNDGIERARSRLARIVGRDVEGLGEAEMLRAVAETAAENGVDGLFGPLFWMLVGVALLSWQPGGQLQPPGPLSLALAYKAASTLDSMLGYRRGRLEWLGTAGARLDDLLTWLPCRLVALSLPLVSRRPHRLLGQVALARQEGRPDPSPNAGLSQAAYAQAAGVRLGGVNRYGGVARAKPILGASYPPADRPAVERILALSNRLELLWLAVSLPLMVAAASLLAQ
ncbi:adenosylcobinamide-phosphate synthase CbiB [Synechococcus sp. CS-1325]|uniref:adenosylcobinamide-phosphate synthase CbiB n=1 Tax=Synechococcus sp. CS-1325 TaxID=2847979 RepID=UPI0026C5AE4A